MRTAVNVVNPKTKKRTFGVLNPLNGVVNLINGVKYSISYLTKVAGSDGVGYFETRDNGKIIQKQGKYKS
jgi:hypothetical protein